LGIAREQDGLALTTAGELYLAAGAQPSPAEIAAGPRVGIGYAGEAVAWPLRFALKGHPHVSRPRL
jgi:DNA-3-methyladenine glycosylase